MTPRAQRRHCCSVIPSRRVHSTEGARSGWDGCSWNVTAQARREAETVRVYRASPQEGREGRSKHERGLPAVGLELLFLTQQRT